jgi:hypothetical protein
MKRVVHASFSIPAHGLTLALIISSVPAYALHAASDLLNQQADRIILVGVYRARQNMRTPILQCVTAILFCVRFLAAQHVDGTELKEVIIFGRHSMRAPLAPDSYLDSYSARPYPAFSVAPGILTENGAKLSTILGSYYRLWLTKEGLLTGNDSAGAPFVYFRANVLHREGAARLGYGTAMCGTLRTRRNH